MKQAISLNGVIDMHVHTAPDICQRTYNDLELTAAAVHAGHAMYGQRACCRRRAQKYILCFEEPSVLSVTIYRRYRGYTYSKSSQRVDEEDVRSSRGQA